MDDDLLPVSGSELPYDAVKWNENALVQRSHNCFSYAFDDVRASNVKRCRAKGKDSCRPVWPQPNVPRELVRSRRDRFQCNIMHRELTEQTGVEVGNRFTACPPGSYKISLVLATGSNYHFYRQDDSGYWSHKDGGTPAMRLDASGNVIVDPQTADRKYKRLDYDTFCGYYCARPDDVTIPLE